MRFRRAGFGLAALLVVGCGRERTPEPDPFAQYEWTVVMRRHSSTAPKFVPTYGRVDFVVDNGYEQFDSRSGVVLRHPGGEPDATTRVELSAAERDTLWTILAGNGFLQAPGLVGKGSPGMEPEISAIDIEVVADSLNYAVRWDPTIPELNPEMDAGRNPRPIDPEELGLFEFSKRLRGMLERRASYRNLPRGMPRL
jgi:hypothetical protein